MLCHELRDPLPAIIGAALAIDRRPGTREQCDRMLMSCCVKGAPSPAGRRPSGREPHVHRQDPNRGSRRWTCRRAWQPRRVVALGPFGCCAIVFEGEAAWIEGDAARIEHPASNLIGNALNARPPARSPPRASRARRTWRFSRRSTGPRHPCRIRRRVFEPLAQGHAHSRDRNWRVGSARAPSCRAALMPHRHQRRPRLPRRDTRRRVAPERPTLQGRPRRG